MKSEYIGVDEFDFEVSVYPNPTSEVLNIELSEMATSINIIGLDGKVLSHNDVNSLSTSVDVSMLKSGMYFYEVISESGKMIRKSFVKK